MSFPGVPPLLNKIANVGNVVTKGSGTGGGTAMIKTLAVATVAGLSVKNHYHSNPQGGNVGVMVG